MLADIRIIGAIDEDAYAEFCVNLDALENITPTSKRPKRVTLEIMSDGGNAYSALAFVSRMRLSPLQFRTLASGRVASAATLILAAGNERFMTRESWLMVHEDSGGVEGTVSQMEAEIFHMRAMEDQWNKMLADWSHGKSSKESFDELHKRGDTNMNARECLEWGLIDEII